MDGFNAKIMSIARSVLCFCCCFFVFPCPGVMYFICSSCELPGPGHTSLGLAVLPMGSSFGTEPPSGKWDGDLLQGPEEAPRSCRHPSRLVLLLGGQWRSVRGPHALSSFGRLFQPASAALPVMAMCGDSQLRVSLRTGKL